MGTSQDRYRQVAALHAANIDQGFLSTLGEGFLALVYQAIDDSPTSVLLVEERDGRVVGFVSGTDGMGPIYRRLLRRPFSLGLSLLPSLVRPARVRRMLEILRYGGDKPEAASWPRAELLSIAVSADVRGQGVAETLYRGLEAEFRARGVDEFRIVVGENLLPAHRFYQRMGAKPVGRIEVHAGEASIVYRQAYRIAGAMPR